MRLEQYIKRANLSMNMLFKHLDTVTVISDKELIEDMIVQLIATIKSLGGTPAISLNDLNKRNGH